MFQILRRVVESWPHLEQEHVAVLDFNFEIELISDLRSWASLLQEIAGRP